MKRVSYRRPTNIRRWRSKSSRPGGGAWSACRPSHFTLQVMSPWCPLSRRLGGPRIRSGHFGVGKNFLAIPGSTILQNVYRISAPYEVLECQRLMKLHAICWWSRGENFEVAPNFHHYQRSVLPPVSLQFLLRGENIADKRWEGKFLENWVHEGLRKLAV